MHVGHVGFCKVRFDLDILACIRLWIQLDSMKLTLEERPETALYCSVGLLAIAFLHCMRIITMNACLQLQDLACVVLGEARVSRKWHHSMPFHIIYS